MPGLFDLPSEIVFTIIEYVLSASYPLPPYAKRRRASTNTGSRTIACVADLGGPWPPNSLSLLLTNRRLYAETTQYLKSSNTFKLDLAIVNNNWLWPTWKYIPTRTINATLDLVVEVNVILCCTEDERILQVHWPIWTSPYTETNVMRCIMDIVFNLIAGRHSATDLTNLFLRHWEPLGAPGQFSSVQITDLIINADSTRYHSGNETISQDVVPLRRVEDLGHLEFNPLYPIDSKNTKNLVRKGLESVLLRMLREEESSRTLLKKYVSKITFCIDGNKEGIYDLGHY